MHAFLFCFSFLNILLHSGAGIYVPFDQIVSFHLMHYTEILLALAAIYLASG